MGMALGLAVFLSGNIVSFLTMAGEEPISVCLQPSPPFTANFRECLAIFFEFSKVNVRLLSMLWLGTAAGLSAQIFDKAHLKLGVLLVGGVTAKLVIMTALFWVVEIPSEFVQRFLPEIFTTALAMMVVALALESIQSEAAQKRFSQMELSLAQAELRALRSQINPHFFFNSLNALRAEGFGKHHGGTADATADIKYFFFVNIHTAHDLAYLFRSAGGEKAFAEHQGEMSNETVVVIVSGIIHRKGWHGSSTKFKLESVLKLLCQPQTRRRMRSLA